MKKIIYMLFTIAIFFPANTMTAQENTSTSFKVITNPTLNVSNYFSSLGLSSDNVFTLTKSIETIDSKHYVYKQTYKGINITGSSVVLHEYNDTLKYVTGLLMDSLNVNVIPGVDSTAAQTAAINYIKTAEFTRFEIPLSQDMVIDSLYPVVSKLAVAKLPYESDIAQNYKLYYLVRVYPVFPIEDDFIAYVDANSSVITYYQSEKMSSTPGHVTTLYYGYQTVDTQWGGNINKYRLIDDSRGNGIETVKCRHQGGALYCSTNHYINDNDNIWDDDYNEQIAASTHWGAQVIWDYYLDTLGRNGPDGAGRGLNILPDQTSGTSNDSSPNKNPMEMTFAGPISGPSSPICNPRISLNDIGHEFTHGVFYHDGIASAIQDGTDAYAIMEALCDIFGEFAEYNFQGWVDWEYDAQSWVDQTQIRAFHQPIFNGKDAMYYGDANWVANTSGYYRGGILRHWVYMLSMGEMGTNHLNNVYCVKPIGIKKVEKILYQTLHQGNITSLAVSFNDLMYATIAVATSLYGVNGTICPEVAEIISAWYAINVGAAPSVAIPFVYILNKTDGTNNNYNFNRDIYLQNYIVNNGAVVDVSSANEITFFADVEIHSGSDFHAYIAPGCNGGAREANLTDEVAESQIWTKNNLNNKNVESEFAIIPNPNSGDFRIVFGNDVKSISSVSILNLLGLTIYESQNPEINNELNVNIKNVDKGLYIVKVNYDGKVSSKKIVID